MGKFWLVSAAIESGHVWLAVIGVLNSALSLYYYIRLVVFMYLKKEATGSEPTTTPALTLTLALAIVATIVLGVYPRLLFEVAEKSAHTLGLGGMAAAIR
jgi:NADH-quinone oxidoreductase subunit N